MMNKSDNNLPQLQSAKPAQPGTFPPVITNPHYQMLGGEQGIQKLVERFYALMDELPQARKIRELHPADLSHAKERLFMFLSGWLGGPPLYEERFGHPRLRQKHQSFPIGEAERDVWMLCMTLALDEVIAEPSLRTQLTQSFFKTADFLRNL
ncbi:MAG: group II truncated hemoglobin [Gallionellaceae bacterium]|jgi:hemoglobin